MLRKCIIFLYHDFFMINFCCFLVNCWPSENGNGGCDVNIEYELQMEKLELNDVEIQIPVK